MSETLPRVFYVDGIRHERNSQCPALLKTKPGFRCENLGRYLLGSDPYGLWLVCGVHRQRDAAERMGRA